MGFVSLAVGGWLGAPAFWDILAVLVGVHHEDPKVARSFSQAFWAENVSLAGWAAATWFHRLCVLVQNEERQRGKPRRYTFYCFGSRPEEAVDVEEQGWGQCWHAAALPGPARVRRAGPRAAAAAAPRGASAYRL